MGGNALKNTYTERKTTKDFNRIFNELEPILREKLGTEIHLVKSYHEKETHGDMDLLIKVDHEFYNKGINLKNFIMDTFNPNDIYNNGSVLSFDYDEFQIDLIPVKESNWETSITFFDYDPTGNLMGKIAHKFGMKYGFDGLVYPFRNFNGRLSKNIVLSKDNHRIFEFLGYDYNRFLEGFNTVEEIFEFIINSKYFDHRNFLMENLNHIDRKRNKKRKTYQEFLKYIDENNINKTFDFKRDKSEYLDFIDENFPEIKIKEELNDFMKKDSENQLLNERFNGKLIMNHFPELKGKELGDAITKFKKSIGDFKTYGLNHTSDEIMEDFTKFIKE